MTDARVLADLLFNTILDEQLKHPDLRTVDIMLPILTAAINAVRREERASVYQEIAAVCRAQTEGKQGGGG